jgi:hypothetical protein
VLTETGFDFPFKRALLARYDPEAAVPAELLAKIESASAIFKDIWAAHSQAPVSCGPFSEEEQRAVATGQFCSVARRPNAGGSKKEGAHPPHHQHPRYNREPAAEGTTASAPSYPHQAPPQQQQQQQQPTHYQQQAVPEPHQYRRDPSWDPLQQARVKPEIASDRVPGKSLMSMLRRKELEAERTVERAREERFNAPLNARKHVPPPEGAPGAPPTAAPKIVHDLSDLDGHEDDGHWDDPVPRAAAGAGFDAQGRFVERPSAMAPPVGTASAWQATRRLPSSQPSAAAPQPAHAPAQQPKPVTPLAQSMPGRPLITQQTRWVYRDPNGQTQGPFGNAKMLEWYSRSYFPDNLPLRREDDSEYEPLSAWKAKCGMAPFMAPASTAGGAAAPQTVTLGSASTELHPLASTSPLAKFFDLNISLPSNPPSARSAHLGPMAATPKALNEEESRFLSQLGLGFAKPAAAEPAETKSVAPARPTQPGAEAPKWGTAPQGKPVDLSLEPSPLSIKPGRASPPAPPGQAPANAPPAAPQAPLAGWAKPATAVKPLEEILKEEAAAAAPQRPTPASSGPKSFAELMKGAAAQPPPQPQQPKQAALPPRPAPQPIQSTQAPKVSPVLGQVKTPKGQQYDPLADTRAWCLQALKPLAPLYDVDTCCGLLLDMASPAELAAFVQANLRSDRLDTKVFLEELIRRRFGPALAAQFVEEQEDFVTVDRRQKSKK